MGSAVPEPTAQMENSRSNQVSRKPPSKGALVLASAGPSALQPDGGCPSGGTGNSARRRAGSQGNEQQSPRVHLYIHVSVSATGKSDKGVFDFFPSTLEVFWSTVASQMQN